MKGVIFRIHGRSHLDKLSLYELTGKKIRFVLDMTGEYDVVLVVCFWR